MDYETQDIQTALAVNGMLYDDEVVALYRAAREAKLGIVEIGSYTGMSSIALALGSKRGNNVPVYCIDPHEHYVTDVFTFTDDVRGKFMQNVLNAGVADIVRLVNLTSSEVYEALEYLIAVDMLFIDGDHSEQAVEADLRHYAPMLHSGHIFLHDCNLESVQRALATFESTSPYCVRRPDIHYLAHYEVTE